FCFFNGTRTPEIYTLSLHDALPIWLVRRVLGLERPQMPHGGPPLPADEIASIRDWIDQGALGPDSVEPIVTAKPVKHWAKRFRLDRKSTRLNSSHVAISYAVFCLKK